MPGPSGPVIAAVPIGPGATIGPHLLHPPVHVGSPGVIAATPIEPGAPIGPHLNPPQPHLIARLLRVGVFLLFCNDNPRQTTFSRDWAARAMGVTASYLIRQSARRQSIVSTVVDWIELPITSAEWLSTSAQGIDPVRTLIEEETGSEIEDIDHILIGIDVPGASGGTTLGGYTYLAAQNFTPQLIAHELGHRFGAEDAFGETPNGTIRYQNPFCAMGAGTWPATFAHPDLDDPDAVGLGATGPGMSAPTLIGTTWLDPDQRNVAVDLTGTDVFNGGRVETLGVLNGAPAPTWSGLPVVIRYGDLLFEYRVRSAEGWDRGLADPGPGAVGHLVAHRSPDGAPVATLVSSIAAAPGAAMRLGPDNPLDLGSPGPLVVSVLSADPSGSQVRLSFRRRPADFLGRLSPLTPIPVDVDTLVWTREGGAHPVPRWSALERVVQAVAEVQALHELTLVATADEADAIAGRTEVVLAALAERVQDVPARAPRSSLTRALEGLAALEAVQESLAANPPTPDSTELREQGRSELAAVRQLLLDSIRDESARDPATPT